MSKRTKILLIAGIAVVVIVAAVLLGLLLPGGNSNAADGPVAIGGDMTYTVEVKNANGQPLAGVGVYIYEDQTMSELVWYDTTGEDGKMSFTNAVADTYVAVLSDVPTGYAAEDFYPITGELTQIVLKTGVVDAESMQNVTLSLGDLMMDFTIVDTDGVEHTLSELLKTKRAVVLNFWYIECKPCNLEFPYMQEAYEKYSDVIEILAMNPLNTDEAAIAAFKEEMGLTFPMAMVDEAWAQLMKLTAYPTTVIIDRYGNISLVHTGMIDNTDTFEQVFAYFTADDYEPITIESIDDIVTKEVGSEDNPELKGGDRNFNITVGAGETYYFELFKLTTKIYMTVEGEGSFVVNYNGKDYKSSDGSVTITIKPEGPSVPVPITVTNKSDTEQTYEVTLGSPKGSYGNPYTLKLGEFTAKTKAGDEQGTYYVYTATKSGTMTVKCLSSSVKKYGFFLYNLDSYAMRNTDEDGRTDEDGYVYVSVQVKKGQKIQFNVAVARDDNNNIAAGTFKFLATFEEGTGEEEGKVELPQTTYSVTATDETGAPLSGVTVYFKGSLSYTPPVEETTTVSDDTVAEDDTAGEGTTEEPVIYTQEIDQYVTTGEDGVASVTGLPGTVNATVRIPDGYRLETTQYTLTEEAPAVTVQLTRIVYKDYTVTVTYPNGDPVADSLVIVGSGVGFTDEDGKVAFHLEEDTYSARVLKVPDRYVVAQDSYPFAGALGVTVALDYAEGADASNPIVVDGAITFTTSALAAGESEYYAVYGVGGTTLKIQDADAKVIIGGVEYTPDEEGLLAVEIGEEAPVAITVVNNGAAEKAFTARFSGFSLGSVQNPATIRNIKKFNVSIPAGAQGGYYSTWTSTDGDGTLTLTTSSACDVIVTSGEETAKMSDSEGGNTLTIRFAKDVPVLIQCIADPEADGTYPALRASFTGIMVLDTGVTYSVTVVDESEAAQSGVKVQFMQEGTVVKTAITGDSGVASAVLTAGSYTVAFADSSIICDTSAVILTEEAPAVTLTVSREEDPVADGMTRYSVSVEDYKGNSIGDVLVLFSQDGATGGYSEIGEDGGNATIDLKSGSYDITLYFLGDTKYYYEETTAKVTESDPKVKIKVAEAPASAGEDHYYFGTLTSVAVGGTYVVAQTDALTFYSFYPTEQGVYYISATDPNAVLTYWGQSAYVSGDLSSTLEDYTPQGFSVSVNTNALGRNIVIGVTGTKDTLLNIVRTGDAVEDAEYETYVPKTTPTQYTVSGKKTFTKVDLTASTDTYKLVLNEADGYYHIGSANGPVMYIQVTFNNEDPDSPITPSYIHLYDMVGGVSNTGTGFKCVYTDTEGNKHYEDYTQAMLDFGACADPTYGVYPLTEDLAYILQMGGAHKGWWNPDDLNNCLFKNDAGELDTSINLEIAWLFAGCYIDDGSVVKRSVEIETPVEEEVPAEETPVEEEIPAGETPAEEETPVEEEIPAEGEAPAEEIPAEGETPVEEEAPPEEEAPAEEQTPTEEEAPQE